MASMTYDEAATRRLEAVYQGADIVAQRAHTLGLLNLKAGEHVLDIGSGPGFLAAEMGEKVGPAGRVRGIDLSPVMVARAAGRCPQAWISFAEGDATALAEADGAYDLVVSTQVAEYVPDIARFCSEAFRVLKPGGRAVILATDWDSIAWHTEHPDRMRAVMAAYASHCADSALPRTLARRLVQAGFAVDRVSSWPILNRDWSEQNYSCMTIGFIAGYVRSRNLVAEDILAAWEAEQRDLAARGAYFFLCNRVFFQASRPV